jgi:7-cyano-7-deazaguanine reductase
MTIMLETMPCPQGIHRQAHIIPLPAMCPISRNPGPGSFVMLSYEPCDLVLEVYSVHQYLRSFIGGKGKIRTMEETITRIATDIQEALQTPVSVTAVIHLTNGDQLICSST